jgi:hypothetical protein
MSLPGSFARLANAHLDRRDGNVAGWPFMTAPIQQESAFVNSARRVHSFSGMNLRLSEECHRAYQDLSAARELVSKFARDLVRGDADARVCLESALAREAETKRLFTEAMAREAVPS